MTALAFEQLAAFVAHSSGLSPGSRPGYLEQDIRIVQVEQKVSKRIRTLAGAQNSASMRFHLSTVPKHNRRRSTVVGLFDVLTEFPSGNALSGRLG